VSAPVIEDLPPEAMIKDLEQLLEHARAGRIYNMLITSELKGEHRTHARSWLCGDGSRIEGFLNRTLEAIDNVLVLELGRLGEPRKLNG
jgi:hypothetical protein